MDNHRDLELLKYLQNLLKDDSRDQQTSCEVLEYFLRRLASSSKQNRVNSIKGLQLLLKVFHKDDEDIQMNPDESGWLLHYLPMMPHFPAVRMIVIAQLRAACQIENNAELVMIYIQFIAANTLHDPVTGTYKYSTKMTFSESQSVISNFPCFRNAGPRDGSKYTGSRAQHTFFMHCTNY